MIYFICYSWRILSSFKNNLYRSFTQFIILSLPELIESFPASKKKTDRKLIGKRPLPAPDVFSITHVPLTTRNVFVTCDTTQRTSFRNNNCGLKNFQSAVKANGFHIKWNWFWKPLSFDQKCGWQQLERSTTGWQTSLSFLSFYACIASGETGSGGQNPAVWPFKMEHLWEYFHTITRYCFPAFCKMKFGNFN